MTYLQLHQSDYFGIFDKLLSTQNVNGARFARNVECDFFCDFQTPCAGAQSLEEPNRIRIGVAFHSESGYKHKGAQSLIGRDIGFITVDTPFIFIPGVVERAKFPQENVKFKGTSSVFTVCENQIKSLIQHSERSELHFDFERTKVHSKCQKCNVLASL